MYEHFNLHDALSVESVTNDMSYGIEGVGDVLKILKSRDTSTESFLDAGKASINEATLDVLFVQKSLEGLSERLKISANAIERVKKMKKMGRESYQNVAIPDVWSLSIEGKVGEFFKKVWAAILTAIRRIIVAIANFVKMVRNTILGAGAKKRVQDYEHFVANRAKFEKAIKAKGKTLEVPTLRWKINSVGDIEKILRDISAVMISGNKSAISKEADTLLASFEGIDWKNLKTKEDLDKYLASKRGIKGAGQSGLDALRDKVKHLRDSIVREMASNRNKVSSSTSAVGTSKAFVDGMFLTGTKGNQGTLVKMSVADLYKKSSSFAILGAGWTGKHIKSAVVSGDSAQKDLTKLTATLDKISKKFNSFNPEQVKESKGDINSLSSVLSSLANERVKYNTYFSGILLDTTAMVFRFQDAAHRALLLVKRTMGKDAKAAKAKSGESLSAGADSFDSSFFAGLNF